VDQKRDCPGWKQIVSPSFTLDEEYKGRRDAKIFKIMPHLFLPDYDYWIWTDPTHEAVVPPKEFCSLLKSKDIGLFEHPHRKCAYEELVEVDKLSYDHKEFLSSQHTYFESRGFPTNQGLYELPVLVRKNTSTMRAMNQRWWEVICRYSSRDQTSLPFVMWSMGVTPFIYEGYANNGLYQNPYLPQVRWKGQ
jgi:hypothetical protein